MCHSDYLEDAAPVSLMKNELLLEQRIERPPGRPGLGLGQALLAADQVDLDPGGGQDLGAGLALQAPGSDHLHLEVASLVHEAELDVTEDGGAEDLAAHQLPGAQARYELVQLLLVLLRRHPLTKKRLHKICLLTMMIVTSLIWSPG